MARQWSPLKPGQRVSILLYPHAVTTALPQSILGVVIHMEAHGIEFLHQGEAYFVKFDDAERIFVS